MIPDSAIGAMEARLAELIADRRMITKEAEKRGRKTLDDVQTHDFKRLSAEIADLREGIDGAKEDNARRAGGRSAADKLFNASQANTSQGKTMNQYANESRVYNQHTAREGRSFWRDLVLHKTGDDATGEARAPERTRPRAAHRTDDHRRRIVVFAPGLPRASLD